MIIYHNHIIQEVKCLVASICLVSIPGPPLVQMEICIIMKSAENGYKARTLKDKMFNRVSSYQQRKLLYFPDETKFTKEKYFMTMAVKILKQNSMCQTKPTHKQTTKSPNVMNVW